MIETDASIVGMSGGMMDANEVTMWVSHAQTSLEFSDDGYGATKLGEAVETLRAELKTLRMADDLHQQGAELMREEMARLKEEFAALKAEYAELDVVAQDQSDLILRLHAELAALKAAAGPIIAGYVDVKNHATWDGKKVTPKMTVIGGSTVAEWDELARLCGEG